MSDVPETQAVERRRREPGDGDEPVVDAALAEELVSRAREQGVERLEENRLLRQMTKAVLERGLAEELTEHLGFEPHERSGTGNARNGTTPHTRPHRTEAQKVDSRWPCRVGPSQVGGGMMRRMVRSGCAVS
jgi:ParB-like chromosome segregation protein Spo0J